MKVLVRSTGDFIHGEFNMRPGDEAVMDSHLAEELKHLVTIIPTDTQSGDDQKMAPPDKNKMLPGAEHNKAADEGDEGKDDTGEDGEDATSSALPAAPASPKKTASPSVFGVKKTQGKGKRS